MKRTAKCPKCENKRIAVLAEFLVPSQETANTARPFPPITIEIHQRTGTTFWDRHESWERKTLGRFETWTCLACGYTEFYACALEGIEDLAKQHPNHVRILDDDKQGGGPFR